MNTVPRLGLAGVTAIAVVCTALGVVVPAAPEGIQPAATCPWLSPADAAGHRGERLTICGTAGQQVHRLDDGGLSLGLLDEGGERLRIVVPASGGSLSRLQGKPVWGANASGLPRTLMPASWPFFVCPFVLLSGFAPAHQAVAGEERLSRRARCRQPREERVGPFLTVTGSRAALAYVSWSSLVSVAGVPWTRVAKRLAQGTRQRGTLGRQGHASTAPQLRREQYCR